VTPTIVVFLTVVLDLVGFGIVIPLMTYYAESFGARDWQVPLLMACFSIAQFLFAPLWGQLSDRVGRRPVLLASIALTAVSLAGFASARSLGMLFLWRSLHGMMTANVSTAQACMADLTTRENRAKGMGLIGAAFGIGFTIGPFIGGEMARFGYAAPIWLAAGLSAANLLCAWRWLPETRRPDAAPTSRSIDPAVLIAALRHPVMGLCILLLALHVFSFAMMESCFTLFAWHRHGVDAAQAGRLFGLAGVTGIVVQGALIGRLVKRFGEPPLVAVGLVLTGIATTALSATPPGWPMFALFPLIAVGQGLVTPTLQALISRAGGAEEQGSVLGSAQSMSALARATGPVLGGLLYSKAFPEAPFWAAGALLVVAAVLSIPATARARPLLTAR
jgi:multidrug resistance protein